MSILLFSTGEIGKGLIMVAGGTVVVGLVDNLLRPVLVGREAKLPDYLVLLGTLGGLTVFGIAGFVAGPIIAALFLVLWEMFSEEYAPLDSSETAATPSDAAIASRAETVAAQPAGGAAAAVAEAIRLDEAGLRAGPPQPVETGGTADPAAPD
jgi:hypothetical protein